jgi:crossover junction endodeoxyribonuclease RusA
VRLNLPIPPSVNGYWRFLPTGRGRMSVVIAEEGKRFRAVVWAEARRRRYSMIPGPVSVLVTVTRPDFRRRDLDNIGKATLDALVFAKLIDDDALVLDWHVRDGFVIDGVGSLDVEIAAMEVPEYEDRR